MLNIKNDDTLTVSWYVVDSKTNKAKHNHLGGKFFWSEKHHAIFPMPQSDKQKSWVGRMWCGVPAYVGEDGVVHELNQPFAFWELTEEMLNKNPEKE